MTRLLRLLPLPLTIGGLVVGLALEWAGRPDLANWAWALPTALVGVRLALGILRDLLRRRAGVDVIALLAIGGALALGELFAAAIIGVMLATGEALEAYAEGRARRELDALLARAPQSVRRYEDGQLVERPISDVTPGDRLLVRPGEVVPVDGLVSGGAAVLDESAMTGESRLVTRADGDEVASGVVNAGGSFDLHATATAAESTYAGIVRLVEEAERDRAPFVRLADRYALLFVPLTLAVTGLAWLISGDPLRALAVLVVATPCPLLLAAPIAIVAGISRSARRGVIVKGGGALETLARARVLLLDKTGTLTAGRPQLTAVESPSGDQDEVLRLAAAVEQASPHVLGSAIVRAARERGLALPVPTEVSEQPGAGVSGTVDRRTVVVGALQYALAGESAPQWARELRRRAELDATTLVFVAIDGALAGAIVLEDPLRPESARVIRGLRRSGFGRVVMVTGDHHAVAEIVGAAIGVDAVLAERRPTDKVDAVHAERALADGPLVMVGDGLNDAPALAAADVGVAMGARGATASSEAADMVITVDRLDRLAEAVGIARRSHSIAVQSVVAGMGMSIVAMGFAAFGFLPVVAGAILQELIDLASIANALRALRGGVPQPIRVEGWQQTRERLVAEHSHLAPGIGKLRALADRLDTLPDAEVRAELSAIREFLADELMPHELAEDRTVYRELSMAMGRDDATAALHRMHTEIFHLVRLLERAMADLGNEPPSADDRTDVRRTLYGLDAILRLHMAQEEELYESIADTRALEVAAQAA
ncbi:heavy metal translocating P-type ATPase [soil metagenome]